MRFVFLGDIMGKAGRKAVAKHVPTIRQKLEPHFIIANGENAAGGRGITKKTADEIFAAGIDLITGGNHSWSQREIFDQMDEVPHLLRPHNYPNGTPGNGFRVLVKDDLRLLVINVMGQLSMPPPILSNPFEAVEEVLKTHAIGEDVDAIFVDFHAEVTGEKMAMAHWFDGQISAVIGTHTHIPTSDAQILDGGTAIMCDAGMCGDYNSVIGMETSSVIERYSRKLSLRAMGTARGEGTVCGAFIETDDKTGLAVRIEPIRLGPRLHEHMPVL